MGDLFDLNKPLDKGASCCVLLMKDQKSICQTKCHKPTFRMPPILEIEKGFGHKSDNILQGLPRCLLHPDPVDSRQKQEWIKFLSFLQEHKRVAIAVTGSCDYYILPPNEASKFGHAFVLYRMKTANHAVDACFDGKRQSSVGESVESGSRMVEKKCYSDHKFQDIGDQHAPESGVENNSKSENDVLGENGPLEKNYVRAHPSYLKTLSQAHSGWIFGAVAELVDNSRDANATRLEISIDLIYSKNAGKEIPMLSVVDDGHGMTHREIVRMLAFGHKQPDADDADHIGRFGIGFKTGAMRLGKDALVLTQTSNSRSIAFLSQSLNEGKDNLEIPIVSYCRKGQFMEVDTSVQTEALAKFNLKAIKEFSPFNKYLIGEKVGLFEAEGTGTQIYIWNLDEWGSNYFLEWNNGMSGGSSFHQGDIFIRSRRSRSRPGQMTRLVPLDSSLRTYLEVIFLDPRMKIHVQGSLVKSIPLAKSLNKTVVENGIIMGKPVQLTLGRCQLEWEQANCGIFLYWHGRLIEAYKRVGSMIHNGDKSHGIIGVVDVTELMNDGNGRVWVHSNKQGFQDCEAYAQLEEWLGVRADKYLDENVDKLQVKKGGPLCKPDHEWVQCDKCRKWRMLSADFDSKTLPQEWFCYMKPFVGNCEMPEQKVERGVITICAKRSGYDLMENPVGPIDGLHGNANISPKGK
ncbi:hypothetical protein LguiA_013836 [Lonicera macranthoides]